MIRVYTSGVFDLFHAGHLRALKKAKSYGDWLLVGVSSDEDTAAYKRTPIIPLEQRIEILQNIKCVDEVIEAAVGADRDFYIKHQIDIHCQGDAMPPVYRDGNNLGIMRFIGRESIIDSSTIIAKVLNCQTESKIG